MHTLLSRVTAPYILELLSQHNPKQIIYIQCPYFTALNNQSILVCLRCVQKLSVVSLRCSAIYKVNGLVNKTYIVKAYGQIDIIF